MANSITSYPKDKIKVVFFENISPAAYQIFQQNDYANIKSFNKALPEKELIAEIQDAHIVGIRSKTDLNAEVLAHAKKLLAVGCFCIGTNQVNLKSASDSGIAVFNAPHSNTRSVAELVISLSILLIRKIVDKNLAAHKGIWEKKSENSFEIRGKTLGIIGYGNIGTQVGILAESLGIKVLFYDVVKKLALGNAQQVDTMQQLLANSDMVTLHIPEDSTTQNLMDSSKIFAMKKGSILINYARGTVVDLIALKKAIETNHISGAAIDVFPKEPEKNGDAFTCPLQNLPNVILTPHIGGSTEEAQKNIGEDVGYKLLQYLEKGISLDSVNLPPVNLPPVMDAHRVLHIHKNVPGVLSKINNILSDNSANILGQYLQTKNQLGYVVYDIEKTKDVPTFSIDVFKQLRRLPETIKARLVY